jgi:hypothetical protein
MMRIVGAAAGRGAAAPDERQHAAFLGLQAVGSLRALASVVPGKTCLYCGLFHDPAHVAAIVLGERLVVGREDDVPVGIAPDSQAGKRRLVSSLFRGAAGR